MRVKFISRLIFLHQSATAELNQKSQNDLLEHLSKPRSTQNFCGSKLGLMKPEIFARRILSGTLTGLIGLSALTVSAQDSDKLATANNGFAFDLLKQIAKEQPGTNIFISPFSVSTALQMVGNGAAGETKNWQIACCRLGCFHPSPAIPCRRRPAPSRC
jgi:hypothetical protein